MTTRSDRPEGGSAQCFTWDDHDWHAAFARRLPTQVDLLKEAATVLDDGNETDDAAATQALLEWHESMAARIASLLPPREP